MKRAPVCLMLLVLLAFSVPVESQTAATATVTGTVTDPTGAVVPGADVEMVDVATNISRKQSTNDQGNYIFVNVVPATYKIMVTKSGFRRSSVADFKVAVAKSYNLNFTMEVGDISSTVEVYAGTAVEIQTLDATVGNAVGGTELLRLPTANRSAATLLLLQPLVTPGRGVGNDIGGQVAGARSDQTTFLLDGGDSTSNTEGTGGYNTGFDGTPLPMIPVPVESIEEFRVGTSNPNATFGRSQGGQVAMVTKRGTNNLHGSGYWYHQNDNLNANSWDRNFAGLPKAELKDNRYGFSLGGPLIRDRMFMYGHYEGRNFPRTANVNRTVPLTSLKMGILQFRDATGAVVSYNLATSTLCGPTNTNPCDPRGIGISPVVQAIYNILPAPNTASGGDGLNTRNFLATIDNTLKEQFFVTRLDYKLTDTWNTFGSFRYAHTDTSGTQQIDISGITGCTAPCSTRKNPLEPRYLVLGLNGQFSPTWISETRFSWYRHWWEWGTTPPFPQVAGTAAAIQLAGEAANKTIADPMNIDTQNARSRVWNGKDTFISQNMTWLKGRHTVQFGGNFRHESIFHQRTDRVTGGLTGAPIFWARARSGGGGSFISIPTTNRPPTCGGAITTNCLLSGDVGRWNTLYAATLGMIDQSAQVLTRDGQFNAQPLGTGLEAQVLIRAFEGYFQDVWKWSNNFTLTYGVTYQLQRPPTEEQGRQALTVDAASGVPIDLDSYYADRAAAATGGTIFNPDIAFSPIGATGRKYPVDMDKNNWGPRIAAAWQPNWDNWLFGKGKTAIRGGWSVTYTRMNGVGLVMTPILGTGLGNILACRGPNTAGTCTGATDPSTAFRVGPDGTGANILPSAQPIPPATIPFPIVVNAATGAYPEARNFGIDPGMKLGYSHSFDVTWQRELPANHFIEVGYVGRLGRNLIQNTDLNAGVFFHTLAGQTAVDAFENVAAAVRSGTTVANQPYFEASVNGMIANYTQVLMAGFPFEFEVGDLASVMGFGIDTDRLALGLQPFNNIQVLFNNFTSDHGWSDYHSMFVTVRKRTTRGLSWDVNYTLGKSTDVFGINQENTLFSWTSPFRREFDKQPSTFDIRHVLNSHWYYELPFGRGKTYANQGGFVDKLVGGWYIAGLFTANSGVPRCVDAGGNLGTFTGFTCANATTSITENSRHDNVAGSGGVGTNGDPASGGSGLNMFSNPEATFNTLRFPDWRTDQRHGFGDVRGMPRWNLDLSAGKRITFYENVAMVIGFDFLNLFNHVEFANPGTSLTDPSSFGVLDSQFARPRNIQFGLRIEF